MKFLKSFLLLVFCAVVAVAAAHVTVRQDKEEAVRQKETAFQRVMRTNKLRCGYALLPPQLSRDPNTGAFSGITFDLLTEAAKRLGLEVSWDEEVTFPEMLEGFDEGKYDAFCLTAYRWLPAARLVSLSRPVFYSAMAAYVRPDDTRFDADLKPVNSDQVTVAMMEGEADSSVRAERFPLARVHAVPGHADMASLFKAVTDRKADLAFASPLMAMSYTKGLMN